MASTPLQLPAFSLAAPADTCSILGLEGQAGVLQGEDPVAALLAGQAGAAVVSEVGQVVKGVSKELMVLQVGQVVRGLGRDLRVLLLCLGKEATEVPCHWVTLGLEGVEEGGAKLVQGGEVLGQGAVTSVVASNLLPLAYRTAPDIVVIR